MDWKINVQIRSSVPLPCDLDLLNRLDISYSGYTVKPLSQYEKALMFSLDFEVNDSTITIYI